MQRIPRNNDGYRLTLQQELEVRNRDYNYRCATAGLIFVQVAYLGEPYITQLKTILNPIAIKFQSTGQDDIRPNMLAIRMPEYNIFASGGIKQTEQILELAEGGANIQPLYGIPGKVFGALWTISDSIISFMQASWGSINQSTKYFLASHSMGGGLCQIVCARLIKQFNVPWQNIICNYTFGNPKSGDPVFANWLGEQVPNFTSIASGDPTPFVPPAGAQYLWNVVDTVIPNNSPNQVSVQFSYQHVPKTYHLTDHGELETSDGILAGTVLTYQAARALLNQITSSPDDVYAAHSIYHYLYCLSQADYEYSGRPDAYNRLLELSRQMQVANPLFYQISPAPTAEQYTNTVALPAEPVIQPFNPVASGIPSIPAGVPAVSRITGSIRLQPVLNVVAYQQGGLTAVDTSTRPQNYERGYDRRLLETVQSAIKNIRKNDGDRISRGEGANVIFPATAVSLSLAVVSNHIDQLLGYNSGLD